MKYISAVAFAGFLFISSTAFAQTFDGNASYGTTLLNSFDGVGENSQHAKRSFRSIKPSSDLQRLYLNGYDSLKSDHYDEAAKLFSEASANPLASRHVVFMAGASYFLQGNRQEAIRFLEKSLQEHHLASKLLSQNDRVTAEQMLAEMYGS